MSKKARVEYITKYIRQNIQRYEIKLNRKKDGKLIEHINSKTNINAYFRHLVEEDIKKGTN